MFSTLFTHPIDVLKVRLQLRGELRVTNRTIGPRGSDLARVAAEEFRGRGLYRGLSAALLRHSVFSSLRQGGYGILTYSFLTKESGGTMGHLPGRVAAGLVSGLIGAFAANPADFVLVRMQADGHWPLASRRNYRHVFHGLAASSKEEAQGLRIWWRGSPATCCRAGVLTATQLPTYEHTKSLLVRAGLFDPADVSLHILCSTASAATCSLATCPVDVLKTRMMNMNTSGGQAYKGVLDCGVQTLRSEGFGGFWKGLAPTFLRLAPHNILLWVSFEQIMLQLQRM